MNMNDLPIGTIFTSNNTRLIIVGFNQNNQGGYIVCPCSEREVDVKKLYILLPNQVDKVFSLGYVDNVLDNNLKQLDPFNNNVVPTSVNNTGSTGGGKYIFDENGVVIGEQ